MPHGNTAAPLARVSRTGPRGGAGGTFVRSGGEAHRSAKSVPAPRRPCLALAGSDQERRARSRTSRGLTALARAIHESAAIGLLSSVLVVCPAEEPDAIDPVSMRARESVHVIEFERTGFGAPPAPLVRERTTATVTLVDCPLDRIRNVPRGRFVVLFLRDLPGLPADGEPFLLCAFDQEVERLIQDRRHVPVGNPVSKQILCVAQLVSKRPASSNADQLGRPACQPPGS